MRACRPTRQASIDAALCVHARIETSACRACVEVCPKRAWHLDDDGLTLDAVLCDGCGLCVAVCPTASIGAPRGQPIRRHVGTRLTLLAGCEYALPEEGEGRLTCLHAISVTDLLRHWRQGERVWLVVSADCAACPRGGGERFQSRVDQINDLLKSRGSPPILVKAISSAQWLSLRDGREQALHARRGFLRRLLHRPASAMNGGPAAEEPATDRQPPGLYLTGSGPLPWTIRLDPQACVACHACIRVCPTQALRMEPVATDAVVARYRLLHDRCTGCGMCVDVCESKAIGVQRWSRPEREDIPLRTFRCKVCGADCQAPMMRGEGVDTCWVCTRNRPARRLYQVMQD